MSFGSFLRGIVAQANPFDNGRTYGTYNPPKKRIDQPLAPPPSISVQPTNLSNNIPTARTPVSFGTLHINNTVPLPKPQNTISQPSNAEIAARSAGSVASNVAGGLLGAVKGLVGLPSFVANTPNLIRYGKAKLQGNSLDAANASEDIANNRIANTYDKFVNPVTSRLTSAETATDVAAKKLAPWQSNTSKNIAKVTANLIPVDAAVSAVSGAGKAARLRNIQRVEAEAGAGTSTVGATGLPKITPVVVRGGDARPLPIPTRVVRGDTITDVAPRLPGDTPALSPTANPAPNRVQLPGKLIQDVSGGETWQTPDALIAHNAEEAARASADAFNASQKGNVTDVTPRSNKPFSLSPDEVKTNQQKIIDDYAATLKSMGEGNGVAITSDGRRVSNNVRFGDTKGKRMTKADWQAEAENQLTNGKAEPGVQQAFNDVSNPEVQSQLNQEPASAEPGKPINVKQVQTIDVQQVNDVPVNTPETPGKVRVTKTTDPVKAQTDAVAAQTPASVPKNRPNQTLSIQERTKFSDKAQQVGDVTDTVISRADSGDISGARTAADRLYEDPEYGANTARGQALLERGQKLKAYIDSKTGLSAEVSPARQELISSLKEANKQSVRDARALSVARGERAAKAKSMSQDLEGEAATIARKQGMKGELGHRGKYVGVGGDKAEELFNSLRIEAQRNPELSNRIYTLDNVEEALSRAIRGKDLRGADVGAPTKGQIELLRKYFGEDIGDAVEEAVNISKTTREKLLEGAGQVIGAPRSIMASFDLSATLRQGGVLSSRFPKEAAKAAKEQLRYFASSKSFKEGMQEITNRPSYDKMISSGLDVTGTHGLDKAEEQFISTLAEKIPGLGRGVAASDRAYTGFLTKLRADVFDKITNTYAERGIELSDKEMSDLARFINTASGRGDLGRLEDHAKTLSTTLFSPRLWKSRLDMLNPVYYAKLSGPARKYALQSAASFASIAASVLGLAALAGAKVETDLRSSDFGKIKVGNSRYDILGGFQQNLVFAWREITGEKKSTTTGETTKFARGIPDLIKGRSDKEAGVQTGPYTPNRVSIASDLVGNKATPVLGAAGRILSGKDRGGNPVNPLEELARMVVPLGLSGAVDAANDVGSATSPKDFLKGALINSPDVVGISSQTYGSVPTKDKNYDKYAAATDRANQLRDAGALTDSTQIKDALDNGDYNLAIKSYQYQKAQAEANPKSTKKEIARIDNSIKEVQYLQQGVPKTDDGILAHAESGDYDKAIAGLNWKIERSQADGELSNKTKSGIEVDITRFKVAKDNSLPYSDLQLYESTSQTDWASMGRQYMSNGDYNDNYDPETYQKLAQLDDLFTKAGGSYAKGDPTKNKYNPKGAGTDHGKKKKGATMKTDFGTLSSGGNPFAPKAREYQTASLAGTSNIPVINVVRPHIVHEIKTGQV